MVACKSVFQYFVVDAINSLVLPQAAQVGDVILSVDGESVVGMVSPFPARVLLLTFSDSSVLQAVSMIRQRILGLAGTFVVLSFLSQSSSKEYTCVTLHSSAVMQASSPIVPLYSQGEAHSRFK